MSDSFQDGPTSPAKTSADLRAAVKDRLPLDAPNAVHALHAFDLILPELVSYRGGWFRACRFDSGNVDVWFEQFNGDLAAVEAMVNHLDVFEDYPGMAGAEFSIEQERLCISPGLFLAKVGERHVWY